MVKIRDISDLGSSVGSTCCELVQHAACLWKGCAALGNAFLHDTCDAVGEILTAVLDWVGEGEAYGGEGAEGLELHFWYWRMGLNCGGQTGFL